ncbi:MAG TPA: enoyl-CoA hydratase/isomerase family protein [Burkholderiales bacterium]|nr:enoyl-CoA hydratase/isomerase family protein [Burkholderiales bacterium]
MRAGAVHREHRDGVTTLVLDRPERRNALSLPMIEALGRDIARAEGDAACRCLVITGGEHFCAGRDLGAGIGRTLEPVLAYDEAYATIFRALMDLSKPSVAVVRGYAVAGGFTLAMGCDFVLADASARFGALEMNNGFPAAVNSALLAHLAGPRVALELLLFGDRVSAETLYRMGLINRLAADAPELERVAAQFTAALAALDPLAVRLTKEAHRAAASMPLAEALSYAKNLNALLLASGRIEEGARAFAARRKRKPT